MAKENNILRIMRLKIYIQIKKWYEKLKTMLQKLSESTLDLKKLPERENYFKYLRSVQTQTEDGYEKPSESEKNQMYGPCIMTDLKKDLNIYDKSYKPSNRFFHKQNTDGPILPSSSNNFFDA